MSAQNTLVIFITELRKSIRNLLFALGLITLGNFLLAPELLKTVQFHLADKLYFFSVAGPFLAHVKLALFVSFFLLVPWLTSVVWNSLGRAFTVPGKQIFFFIFFTCILFYGGTVFCYFVTLPFGINFLLGFGSEELQPVISIGKFVNFITIFILAFGLIFELPVFMVFLSWVNVFNRHFYERNRRYAILVIAIAAALLTPTPDVVNMMLMGGPLYLLYESGILIIRVLGVGEDGQKTRTQ